MMKQVLPYATSLIAVALIIFGFTQNRQIKKLKITQKKYEELAIQFSELNNQYKATLADYEAIKTNLDLNVGDLAGLTQELGTLHEENKRLYDSLSTRTSKLLENSDLLIEVDSTSEVVDLNDLFNDQN